MNQQFAEYTRSSAFTLTLNEAAIHNILWMDKCLPNDGNGAYYINSRTEREYLKRRGLIKRPPNNENTHAYQLTHAGHWVARLLQEAGFDTDKWSARVEDGRVIVNTNT